MILRTLLLLCAWLAIVWSAALKPKDARLCSDGKTSPLVEGEDNIFPCITDCPNGFICEDKDSPDGGICCPDLDLLYEIYADKSQRDAETEDAFELPNVSNIPVVIVDDKESSATNKEQVEEIAKNAIHSALDSAHEIRRSPIKTTTPSIPVSTTKKYSIVTLSATLSKAITSAPTEPPFVTQPKKIVGINCRRQPLQHKCNSGTTPTQYVVRWYKRHDASCHHYIYGFCPGTRIDLDQTLRTKDDCEALCLSVDEFQQSDLFKFLLTSSKNEDEFAIRSHAVPLAKSSELIDLKEKTKNSEVVSFQSSNDAPMESPEPMLEATLAPQKQCTRLSYRAMCPDGLPSQFIIRWYRQNGGNCLAYGFGYCHGESVMNDQSLKSESECIHYCPEVSQTSSEKFVDFSSRLI